MTRRPPPRIDDNSPEEEARIQRQIAADPEATLTAPPLPVRRRGRPAGSDKTRVTTFIDNDVLAALQSPHEKGWQTRLNATLREALGL